MSPQDYEKLIRDLQRQNESLDLRIAGALGVIHKFGSTDGAHHKQWLLDQVLQSLTASGYKAWVKEFQNGEDGPNSYEWDQGIAP